MKLINQILLFSLCFVVYTSCTSTSNFDFKNSFEGYKGKPSIVKVYYYDVVNKFGEVEKGELHKATISKYDKNGNVISCEVFLDDGAPYSKTTRTYDEEGYLIKEIEERYYKDDYKIGTSTNTFEKTYNYTIKTKEKISADIHEHAITYYFGKEEEDYYYSETSEYDYENRILRTTGTNKFSTYTYVSKYNDKGLIVSTSVEKPTTAKYHKSYEYDKKVL